MRGCINKVIENYLEKRTQFVDIDGVVSYFREIRFGVPQGTIVGPPLFLLYIDNLQEINMSVAIITFTDDTIVLFEENLAKTEKFSGERIQINH